MQEPPFRQSAGVATFLTAVNCNESITLKTSSKFLPVVAGYKIDNLSFLSGPMIKTARQVNGIPILIKKLCGQRVEPKPRNLNIPLGQEGMPSPIAC